MLPGMLLCRRILCAGILGAVAAGLALSPAGSLGQSPPNADAVPQEIVNLDLCTLAYQLYHQSLSLPLDPWYDQFARVGSERRNNICRYARDYATKLGNGTAVATPGGAGFYSGPAAARGWAGGNPELDPILTNYKLINPRIPSLTWDGTNFVATRAPAYITDSIKTVDGVRYQAKPATFPSDTTERFGIRDYPSGKEDRLIVFEGGTGVIGQSEPSWSLMGFVLLRKSSTGYDAHIVFRGSRGGSTGRTVLEAQGLVGVPKGNPDWVTDLSLTKQIDSPAISQTGKVTQGFGKALPTMLGTIKGCCKYLQDNYPAPKRIYVTGHSLGAALASQFTSAVLMGSYGDGLRSDVANWPWNQTKLIAYAQPIPGNPTWAARFDQISPASQHYWVAGDSVVEATSTIVGQVIDTGAHCGVQNKLVKPANCPDNPHEVFVIRAALLRDLSRSAAIPEAIVGVSTWGYYDTPAEMLSGQGKNYIYPGAAAPSIVTEQNLRNVLSRGNLGPECANWLEQVYANMIADRSSYRGPSFASTLTQRRSSIEQAVARMRLDPPADKNQLLDSLESDFQIVDGKLGTPSEEKWIFLGILLNAYQKSTLTVDDLNSRPVIKKCLEWK